MHSGILRARQVYVFSFFLLSLTILLVRLSYLQIIRYPFFASVASDQHTIAIKLPPKRGTIFDRHMRVLAVNLNRDSVYANAREVKRKQKVAQTLSGILGIDARFIADRLSKDKSFVWIKRKVTPLESALIRKAKLKGIELIQESKRFYPNTSLACHAIGASNIDNIGLEGLELVFDRYLSGQDGWLISTRDARQKLVESYQNEFIPPKDGAHLVLTIDEVIQNIAERELRKMYEKYHAKAASIIVMDPKNGDILAMANLPNYDLNNINKRSPDTVRNRAINDFFEPGSVFKVVTASAALEERVVRLNDKFFCENGEYRIGRRILHDHRPHGTLTFKEVIEKSSNIGTVKVASRFGAEKMHRYIKAFGFYDRTGIDLPGEVIGMNRPLSKWSGVSMFAIPMGQEVTATAIQLACAISVIADNGYYVKPRIVKEIIDSNGQQIKTYAPKVIRKVISPQTAQTMRSILMGVIEEGTGKKAKIEEYTAGGKTGTAQKVEPGGVYSHDRFIASFIGFAPVEKPVLSVVVCVDEPRVVYFGGDVAAPIFKNVADESLKYMNAKTSHGGYAPCI